MLWATWCEPCIEELPHLLAHATEHPELSVLAINADLERRTWQAAVASRESPANWVDAYADPKAMERLDAAWRYQALPAHVRLDRGRVVAGPPFCDLACATRTH